MVHTGPPDVLSDPPPVVGGLPLGAGDLSRLSTLTEDAERQRRDAEALVQAAEEEEAAGARKTRAPITRTPSVVARRGSLELAMPLSRSGLGSKSEKDLASFKRSKSAVRLEDEETVVVDVTRLHRKEVDPELRRALLDEALETQEQDNEELLRKVRQRLDRAGVQLSKVEVRFNNLEVSADVNIGSRGMPTVANAFINTPLDLLTSAGVIKSTKHHLTILKGVTGVLKPGRLTLLLGPPSSGKSVLLKALAGLLRDKTNTDGLEVRGDITYNGEHFDSFQVARTSAYISQVDEHQAELTVRETFDFAARCLGTGHKQAYVEELRQRERELGIEPDPEVDALLKAEAVEGKRSNIVTDLMLRVLGLEICADTVVGNQMLRGVSGGQRKRVTTGEMMVGPAKTLFMDEISTGLDSSTTYLIVRCIRNYVHLLDSTVMMSLLQPPPEVFNLFDDVMLLSEGQVVYHGPRENVMPFFNSLGFSIPARKGVADFLQEVTSRRDQQQYWSGDPSEYRFMPITQFHEAYMRSADGKAQLAALEAPTPQLPDHLDPLVRKKYALGPWGSFKACLRRDFTLMRRNSFLYTFNILQTLILAVIAGTLFLRGHIPTDTIQGGTLYLGLIFFSIVHLMFASFAEQSLLIFGLRVFWKQNRSFQFFPAWAYCAPTTLLRMPASVVDAFVWSGIVYWLVGLAPDAGRFFVFTAYLFLLHQMGVALFRLMGALGREMNRTNMFGGFALVILILLSGFALKPQDIHPWWIWMYWASPITYAMAGMSYNEMSAARWSTLRTFPDDNGVPTTRTMGEWILVTNGLFTEEFWWWMPALVLIGYWALFTLITFFALQYLPPPSEANPLFSAEYLADREVNRTGETPPELQAALSASARKKSLKSDSSNKLPAGGSPSTSRSPSSAHAAAGAGATVGPAGSASAATATASFITSRGVFERSSDPSEASSSDNTVLGRVIEQQRQPGNLVLQQQQQPSAGLHSKQGGVGDVEEAGSNMLQRSGSGRGLALPFTPMSVAFKDVSYFVPHPAGQGELQLLHQITGSFRPGVLTALMGVSGAGKTTLLDVLAGRKTAGRMEGQTWVGGYPKVQHTFARICGYVEQSDIHTPRTTVREALVVSGTLRLYDTREKALIEEFVDDVLELVELQPNKDALVGMPGEWGLSVEQRKRLTIAVELVANPSVVFMDEPTSGLDARAAAIVMRAVRNTVDTGRTVVCTIHQPSIDIFDAFNELLLLKRGGHTIYHGPLGRDSASLIAYFTGVVPAVEAPQGELNPATWMLDISAVGAEAKYGVDWADVYDGSELRRYNDVLVEELSHPPPGSQPLHFDRPFAASGWQQFLILTQRWFRSYWRNPAYNATRIVYCVVLAVLLGTIYLWKGQARRNVNDISNIMAALFITMTFLGTSNSSGVQPIVSIERPVFYRELAAGMYSAVPFGFAQVLVEVPYSVLQAVLYGTITYALICFEWTAYKFWYYILFTVLTILFFTYYGEMAIAISPNPQLAAIMSSSVYSVWFIFAGFFIPYASMPPWWSWFYWLNPLSYMIYGVITSQLGDVTDTIIVAPGQTSTVQQLLKDMLGFELWFVKWCALIMAAFVVAFWLLIVTALRVFNFQRR